MAQSVGPKNTSGDLLSKRRLEIEISFRFISSLFLIPLAQSQQISSFDFVETNMFDCSRRIAPSSAGLANDASSPFLARHANENLASETIRFARQNIFSWDSREVDLWQVYLNQITVKLVHSF